VSSTRLIEDVFADDLPVRELEGHLAQNLVRVFEPIKEEPKPVLADGQDKVCMTNSGAAAYTWVRPFLSVIVVVTVSLLEYEALATNQLTIICTTNTKCSVSCYRTSPVGAVVTYYTLAGSLHPSSPISI
jgi:hypothetical protein